MFLTPILTLPTAMLDKVALFTIGLLVRPTRSIVTSVKCSNGCFVRRINAGFLSFLQTDHIFVCKNAGSNAGSDSTRARCRLRQILPPGPSPLIRLNCRTTGMSLNESFAWRLAGFPLLIMIGNNNIGCANGLPIAISNFRNRFSLHNLNIDFLHLFISIFSYLLVCPFSRVGSFPFLLLAVYGSCVPPRRATDKMPQSYPPYFSQTSGC